MFKKTYLVEHLRTAASRPTDIYLGHFYDANFYKNS